MKKLAYAIMFAGTASLSGGVAYLVAPSQVIQASVSSNNNNASVDKSAEDDDWSWAPIELTPAQYFIQNLTDMKSLRIHSGTVNVTSGDFSLAVENLSMDLSIADITSGDIALSASCDILFKGHRLPIEAAYVDGSIYLSALGIDLKAKTDDFSTLMTMLESFGVDSGSLSESSILDNIDMDSVIAELGSMTYEEEKGGYKYTVNLLGIPLIFHSDSDKMATLIEIEEAQVGPVTISANAPTTMSLTNDFVVSSPETKERPFQLFSDYINLIDNVASLAKETRFGMKLEGEISELASDWKLNLDAKLQFDITQKCGKGLLKVGQTLTEYIPSEDDLQLEIDNEDAKFALNNTLYGKFNFDTCRDLFGTISNLLAPETEELFSNIGEALPTLEGTIIEKVIDGEYEYLLDSNWLKKLYVDSSKAELIVSKDLLGTENDIHLVVGLEGGALSSVELLDFSGFGYKGNFKVTLCEYGFVSETLPSEEVRDYMDLTYTNNLIENVLPLLDEKKFAVNLNGGFHEEGKDGVTFEGGAQFDLDTRIGHGKIAITELDKDYDDIPVHNIAIDVDNEDMKFKYNEGLYGKFTLQTLRDLGGMVGELMDNKDSRIYEHIGGLMEEVENLVINDIISGDYYAIATGALKDIDTREDGTTIVVSKELLGLDSDITVDIGYGENGVKSVAIPEFSALGQKIHLNLELTEYDEDYEWLPEDKKYYDFSDIKVLLQFGIDTCDLSYWHLKGGVDIDSMKLGSLDLSTLSGLFVKGEITLEFEIFDDNGDIKVKGKIGNIPSITGVNYHGVPLCLLHNHSKTVEFYYSDATIYLARTEYYKGGLWNLSCNKETRYTKVDSNVFLKEIAYYMVDFVLSVNEDLQADIFSEKEETKENNLAPDYSKLFNEYSYTHNEGDNGYTWYFDVNLGEVLGTDLIEYLRLTAQGEEKESVGRNRGFLTHLDLSTKIKASGFSIAISLKADMLNYDVTLTPDRFKEVTAYNNTLAYIKAHQNDKAMDYSGLK